MRPAAPLVLCAALLACGIDPKKIASHEPYAADGAVVDGGDEVAFAVVGSTRSALYGTRAEPPIAKDLIADIRKEIPVRGIDFLLFTGGFVRRSTNDEWAAFDERWHDILKGSTLSNSKGRKLVEAVPGTGEVLGDSRLRGFGAAFPGIGANIGFNRVASWGAFDVKAGKTTWRILMLDSQKEALGSRWDEELFWLPGAVGKGDYDALLVVLPDPRITLAHGHKMDDDDAVTQLLDIVEDHSDVLKLVAVISGGSPTNELFLPSGSWGEAYLVAGNSGIGMPNLDRWGAADAAGFQDIALEPTYDLALMKEFDRAAVQKNFPETAIDKAKARGSFESYTGFYDGSLFPVQGWWTVTLGGKGLRLDFRMHRDDGSFVDIYSLRYSRDDGWMPGGG